MVKRFEVLYREFAKNPEYILPIYALPLFGTDWSSSRIRYSGLDRDPITPWDNKLATLAQTRMAEIAKKYNIPTWDPDEAFLQQEADVNDILKWAEEDTPGEYEPVWACLAGSKCKPPEFYRMAGFEPNYFGGDYFSPSNDCMCFPRWHGTDKEGVLFRDHFKGLNLYGLFNSAKETVDFLNYYLSFEWTEKGEYQIVEIWIPDANSR